MEGVLIWLSTCLRITTLLKILFLKNITKYMRKSIIDI